MNTRISLVLLAFAGVAASASEPQAKKYTPEIHGMLTDGKQPIASNVCLRQSGSEIRNCGYAGRDGRFFIPSSGPLHSAQAKDQRGEESDLSRPRHERDLRLPHLQALLRFNRLLDRLGGAAHRLREDVQVLESDGHLDDVVGAVDEVLGQEPVQQVDAALVVDLFARDVGPADLVVDRAAGSAYGGRDVIPGLDVPDRRTDLFDDPERFVAQHQVVVAGGRVAIQRVVDLAVGGVDAHLEDSHQHPAAAGADRVG